MNKKNLDLPKEGDIVVVTANIIGQMADRIGDRPIGTCHFIGDGVVAVLFETGDVWWGKSYEVFIHS